MSLRTVFFTTANRLPSGVLNKIRSARFESIMFYIQFLITGKVPMPKSIIIAPATICNLSCPLCPTGTGKLKQDPGFLSLAMYKKILSQIPSVKRVSLFNWGESFLNPEILEIIKYSSRGEKFSTLHTNFNIKRDETFFNELVHSGLDRLSVSLDGASQETYSRYRAGGDFDLVYNNILSLVEAKLRNRKKTPVISWQFIANRFNEHELKKAKEMAGDLGVLFSTMPMDMNERHPDFNLGRDLEELKKKWLPANPRFIEKRYLDKKTKLHSDLYCNFLFSQPVISTDGNVYPCCRLTDEVNAFGNINYEPFEKIWNNEKFTAARQIFRKWKKTTESIDTICHHCQCGCEVDNSPTSRGS